MSAQHQERIAQFLLASSDGKSGSFSSSESRILASPVAICIDPFFINWLILVFRQQDEAMHLMSPLKVQAIGVGSECWCFEGLDRQIARSEAKAVEERLYSERVGAGSRDQAIPWAVAGGRREVRKNGPFGCTLAKHGGFTGNGP